MRWTRWFPWKFIIRRFALSQGFLDPVLLWARLGRFGQPTEVAAPTELLRASAILHARGLINSQTIQYNLDWIWPYWIVRQFNPNDTSFIPRAFSLTHINLTHRNWTAVGLPDVPELPIVDPRGLVTPFFDGWSIEGWIVAPGRAALIPSKAESVSQRLEWEHGLSVVTHALGQDMDLKVEARVVSIEGIPNSRIEFTARSANEAQLVIALRPYNPEGISFVHEIALQQDRAGWLVNGNQRLLFGAKPESVHFSNFGKGDVYHQLDKPEQVSKRECPVGMTTAAASYAIRPQEARQVPIDIPIGKAAGVNSGADPWAEVVKDSCRLKVPDARWQFLYDAAIRSLILHSPGDIYPGPYTYKRFWFRDAAMIIHALVCSGLVGRAEKALEQFEKRQTASGYFLSQEGEWDSNGEALWAIERFCRLTGRPPLPHWKPMIYRGAGWIRRKRLPHHPDSPHAGLFPPGYSAEHLGPSDYYYWDDFWGVAGFRAAADLAEIYGDLKEAEILRTEAKDFLDCIERSLSTAAIRLGHLALPASPYRRMDPGAIGSVAAGYPLQLWDPEDPRMKATIEYLVSKCFFQGGFFQDMSHSGINPYLTLHIAQVFLRAGDPRYLELMRRMAELASSTGQWPEAIHPWTGGGCMGDGQHIWAAAEWLLMMRNCFVREEGNRLVIGSGIPAVWLTQPEKISFGPARTTFGVVSIEIEPHPQGKPHLQLESHWYGAPPALEVRLPGIDPYLL